MHTASCKRNVNKKEEYTHAIETLQLCVRTDVNILRKEQKEWSQSMQDLRKNVANRDQIQQLQSQINEISGTVNEITVKVIELQNDSKTFDYIDKSHTDLQIDRLDTTLQQVQETQDIFKDDLNKLRSTIDHIEEHRRRQPRENQTTNKHPYAIERDSRYTDENIDRRADRNRTRNQQETNRDFFQTDAKIAIF